MSRSASRDRTAVAATTPTAASDSFPPAPEEEKLGRGCRVSRSSAFLDEEYLAASLLRTNTRQRNSADSGRRYHNGCGSTSHDDLFVVNRRYPVREAAKRAMENLHVTLTNANGAAGLDGEEEEDANESSMREFHFRHHPELTEVIKRKGEKQRRRLERRRRRRDRRKRGSSSSSSDDEEISDEDTAESSSSSIADSEDTSSSSAKRSTSGRRTRTTTSTNEMLSRRGSEAGGAGTSTRRAPPRAPRRSITTLSGSHKNDALSIDSSISAESMRDESVERMTQQDRNGRTSPSSSSDNGDGTREFSTEEERRRAWRHAHESVNENVNINYYMADAVGLEDEKKMRRRQLDRRYRWLMRQDEEARARTESAGVGSGSAHTVANGALGDIVPLRIDDDVTFNSVGGLPEHIVALREMVLMPLLYPDLFDRLDLKAPRGVLFVGPPGTGKTLMARALANEGSRFVCGGGGASGFGSLQQRITFFVRKGADMLSKWVGESERQLKLLFEEAKRLQPSIIFFDEVDGLAPTRHAKTEQTQAALVSTLLALLDGLEDRGQVVVIGATNRPDTLDPALRRPGRFDRELVFPLPDTAARRHILTIQLAKKAMPDSAEQRAALLNDLVEMTEGYSGADLGALCTEASLHRLRTALPQLYLRNTRLIVPRELEQARLHVRTEDFYAAAQLMQPSLRRCRSARSTDSCFLDAYVEVLLRGTRDATLAALAPSWPLVDKVLRASSRDCQDMATALRALCAVPIPQPPRPCLLVLHEAQPFSLDASNSPSQRARFAEDGGAQQQQQRRALQLHHLSISLLKGLPGLNHITVNLPELIWESDSSAPAWASWRLSTYAGGNIDYGGAFDDYLGNASADRGEAFTHMSQVVQSVRQCSPCVVYLSGAEEWLCDLQGTDEDDEDKEKEEESKENHTNGSEKQKSIDRSSTTEAVKKVVASRRQQRRVRVFRYFMNMLADTDVIFLLPCATLATCELLFGESPKFAPQDNSSNKADQCRDFASPQSLLGPSVASSELFSAVSPMSPMSPMLAADPPTAVHLTRMLARHQQLHPQFSIVYAGIATTPLPADLKRFIEYVHRIVTMTLLLHQRETTKGSKGDDGTSAFTSNRSLESDDAPVLSEDYAPLPAPLANAQLRSRRRADRAHRCNVWRKVEYRRLQLRHVLMKWVTQYLTSGKFRLLAHADLDFAHDDPRYKTWREHTRKHHIGLQDILEKIEDEKYVCLSQYHDDIDHLVRNVRSFFRTRAAQDQRYRLKALDLKETSLLHMYKMNREVIRFCEETRDLREPSSSDSDDEDGRPHKRQRLDEGGGSEVTHHMDLSTALVRKEEDPALIAEQSRRAVSFSQRPAAPPRKPRRQGWRYSGHRRRRKRGPAAKKAQSKAKESDEDGKEEKKDAVDAEEPSNMSLNSVDDAKKAQAEAQRNADYTKQSEENSNKGSAELFASPRETDEAVESWAFALLSNFTYTRLYYVFKTVMRGLETEVRRLDDEVTQHRQQQQKQIQAPASPLDSSQSVPAAEGTGKGEVAAVTLASTTRESYVTSVFRKLLLAAVQE